MDKLSDPIRLELSRFGAQAGLAEIVARWPDAVGVAIARNAWPARIARDGTLHANTADSVWAFELGHRSAEIAARLGVPRVRFAPGPIPQPEPERAARKPRAATAEQEREAVALASPIEDEKVRESVQKAVLLSFMRTAAGSVLW